MPRAPYILVNSGSSHLDSHEKPINWMMQNVSDKTSYEQWFIKHQLIEGSASWQPYVCSPHLCAASGARSMRSRRNTMRIQLCPPTSRGQLGSKCFSKTIHFTCWNSFIWTSMYGFQKKADTAHWAAQRHLSLREQQGWNQPRIAQLQEMRIVGFRTRSNQTGFLHGFLDGFSKILGGRRSAQHFWSCPNWSDKWQPRPNWPWNRKPRSAWHHDTLATSLWHGRLFFSLRDKRINKEVKVGVIDERNQKYPTYL